MLGKNKYVNTILILLVYLLLSTKFCKLIDGVYLFFILLNLKKMHLSSNEYIYFAILAGWSTTMLMLNISGDQSNFYYTFFFLRIILLYLFYIKIFKFSEKNLSTPLFITGLIFSLSVVINYLHIPSFDFIFDWFTSDHLKGITNLYRVAGFYSGYYTATIMTSSILLYFLFFRKWLYFSILILPSFGAMFCSGRSGFLVIIIGLLFLLLTAIISVLKNRTVFHLNFSFLIYPLIALPFIAVLINYSIKHLPSYSVHTLELVKQIPNILLGDYKDSSTKVLVNDMYYMSEDIKLLFFGDNKSAFPDGSKSDSGYIQMLYGTGVFGIVIYLSFLIYGLVKTDKNHYLLLLYTVMFVLSIKGSLFYSYLFIDYLFVIICINLKRENFQNEEITNTCRL